MIRVEDDSPNGFEILEHAFTLFAPSLKVGDVRKRGRFNFGEKLVLALCNEATIATTTGTVVFDRGERRRRSPKRTEAGSVFTGIMPMLFSERDQLVADALRMIPPPGKQTYINGQLIEPPVLLCEFEHILETEVAGPDGSLRMKMHETTVRVYEVGHAIETAHLYELGIPVVETGDRWHVDIGQKVPLNMERDNVPSRWLADVRAAVANHTRNLLTVEDANAPWARDALSHYECAPETVKRLVELRFGDKAVTFDPSDLEANSIAAARGYTVVHGSQLSAQEWDKVRDAGALLPAGQVTPSPKPFAEGGRQLKMIEPTDAMKRFARLADVISEHLTGEVYPVHFADDQGWKCEGCINERRMIINVCCFPVGFTDPADVRLIEFLIHELAHTVEANHLADRYHDTLCKFGAVVARLALDRPEIFRC